MFDKTTAQKMRFSIKDFFSKNDQIRRKLRIWSHLLKKSLNENFIFCAVDSEYSSLMFKWIRLWKAANSQQNYVKKVLYDDPFALMIWIDFRPPIFKIWDCWNIRSSLFIKLQKYHSIEYINIYNYKETKTK